MNQQLLSELTNIYGDNAADQLTRYQNALTAFRTLYGSLDDVTIFRAPGRVNLIGEHTDYNHGYVMPAALDKDIMLLARPRADSVVRLSNVETHFPPVEFAIDPPIPVGAAGEWGNYARGAAHVLAEYLNRPPHGFDGLVAGAAPHGVPQGAGLSSSSALTVVMAVALAHFVDWQPDPVALVQLCSDAEWYVGTRGGIMDQFVALLAQRNHALFLDCRPTAAPAYRTEPIPLPADYQLLVVDSGVHHTNTRSAFNRRVAACRAGVGLLRQLHVGITHLRDVQEIAWNDLEPQLPEVIDAQSLRAQGIDLDDIPGLTPDAPLKVRACCRHVWHENRRVLAAVDAMRRNDIAALGQLLYAAHASARDDYEISCPELDVLVEAARQVAGVVGARLTGAGWGGCMIALVHADARDEFTRHVHAQYRERTGRDAAIFACRTAPGAGFVAQVQSHSSKF